MLNVCHMTKLKTRMLVYLLLKTSFNYLAFQYFDYMYRLSLSLAFCVLFCRSLFFVLLYFFFWPLCCLFFFDIRILITPLVSSNISYKKRAVRTKFDIIILVPVFTYSRCRPLYN